MRKRARLLAFAFGGLTGCNPSVANYCAPGTPECTPTDGGAGRDGAGGSDATTDVGGCDPSKAPSEQACVVAEAYGVFVSPAGSDTNAGTRSAPVATLGHGMDVAKAAGKRVYVCAGSFGEELVISTSRDGVNVYGGLDCAGWTYGAGNRVVVAPASSGYALELEGLQTGVTLEDLEFDSQSGPSPGASSIAAFAGNSQNVVLERVTLMAGTAADGNPAATSGPGADAGETNWYGTPPAYPELNGASAGDAGAAPFTMCTCPDQSSSTGGPGGGPLSGPLPPGLPSYGDAGAGAAGASGDSCGSGGTGQNGADAPVAMAGTPNTSLGSCSGSGWTPAAGVAGADGRPGQGGGGGGDGRVQSGAGGGGACGGCGGTGGTAGAGGGSSMALLAYQSSVTLVDCLLTAKAAGNGGTGGSGEQGQGGGAPGSGSGQGSGVGCGGGGGGAGAGGNGGQGGAGGLSLGIGYCGTAPTVDGAVISGAASLGGVTLGTAGQGAMGGLGGGAATNSTGLAGADGALGPSGVALAVRSLP